MLSARCTQWIIPADMRQFKGKLLFTKFSLSQNTLFVCVKSQKNYVHLLTNIFIRKQNQAGYQYHCNSWSECINFGWKVQTGILEHFQVILLSAMHFILKRNLSFHFHFVQTLAATGYTLRH